MKYIDTQLKLPQWLGELVWEIRKSVKADFKEYFNENFRRAYLDLPEGADLELIKAPFWIFVLEKAKATIKAYGASKAQEAQAAIYAVWEEFGEKLLELVRGVGND